MLKQAMADSTPSSFPEMIAIPGGRYRMGSDVDYPEEAPAHDVEVGPFLIDPKPVTNAEFAAFVQSTGHVTYAEITPSAADYPGAIQDSLYAGSLVFSQPRRVVNTTDWSQWWRFCAGADWRHPNGPTSSIAGLDEHPVVHVAYSDAYAYAEWAGKALPTEAEWEFAARGGLESAKYAWGEVFRPGGKHMANTWQGRFPVQNLCEDGWEATSPVGTFSPNGYGLFDMIGNVWEWTQDWWQPGHVTESGKACCIPKNPRGPIAGVHDNHAPIPQRVLKGGSFLCSPNYCQRYRPSARHAEAIDTSTCHIGFRCVVRS
jgi:formylglycine-generating enzyme required for sulfatase activity